MTVEEMMAKRDEARDAIAKLGVVEEGPGWKLIDMNPLNVLVRYLVAIGKVPILTDAEIRVLHHRLYEDER